MDGQHGRRDLQFTAVLMGDVCDQTKKRQFVYDVTTGRCQVQLGAIHIDRWIYPLLSVRQFDENIVLLCLISK